MAKKKKITYAQSKEMAKNRDPQIRRDLAGRQDVREEILYFLAEDPDPGVRQQVAANAAAPDLAHILLASDADKTVRETVAKQIARLADGLTSDEADKVREAAFEAMEVLARDQITRVRQVLSETLKDMADAPPDVINRLARDARVAVAGPVLQYSPVLTDSDLLAIIETSKTIGPGMMSAISRRGSLGETVSDAIIKTDDTKSISILLANSNAQIREETLDNLIDKCGSEPTWQKPLVHRSKLSSSAVFRLAQVVADNFVSVLEGRADLDHETAQAVRDEVRKRLANNPAGEARILGDVRKLFRTGRLGEEIISQKLQAGDREFLICALAVLADLPTKKIRQSLDSRNGKAILAIVWAAGLPVEIAVEVQSRIARMPYSTIIKPSRGRSYPLSEAEMRWQLGDRN